jgi:DNA polymerase V
MIREVIIPRNEFIDALDNPGKVSGFVSPAEDYVQKRLHIAERLVTIRLILFTSKQMMIKCDTSV